MAKRDDIWKVITWSIIQGTPVVPSAIARAQNVDIKVVRDACRRAVDAGLLEHEIQSHEYQPAVTLVRADGLDEMALLYLQDIVDEERGEPSTQTGLRCGPCSATRRFPRLLFQPLWFGWMKGFSAVIPLLCRSRREPEKSVR